MPELYTNFARTTLAADISDIDTALTVAVGNGALFESPSGGDYQTISIITANLFTKEVVRVTGRSGDILTIVRGIDPAYPAKPFPAGSIVLSTVTAETLRRFDAGIERVGALVYNSTNISTADSVPQILTFDSERFDTHGFHESVTHPDRLTVPAGKGGLYLLTAGVQFATSAVGWREVYFEINGSIIVSAPIQMAVTTIITIMSVSKFYEMAPGDYARCGVNHTAGAALNVEAAPNYSPEFGIARIGT